MKDIKYRAWDEVRKKMYFPERLFCKKDGTVWHVDLGDTSRIIGQQGFELMQYTGLKDSNGKEIYDGDILEVKDSNGVICRTVVEYTEGAFRVDKWYPKEPTSIEHVNYAGEWEQVEVDIEDYEFLGVVLQHHLEFKVVGNRHEHHHLLGGEEE